VEPNGLVHRDMIWLALELDADDPRPGWRGGG